MDVWKVEICDRWCNQAQKVIIHQKVTNIAESYHFLNETIGLRL